MNQLQELISTDAGNPREQAVKAREWGFYSSHLQRWPEHPTGSVHMDDAGRVMQSVAQTKPE